MHHSPAHSDGSTAVRLSDEALALRIGLALRRSDPVGLAVASTDVHLDPASTIPLSLIVTDEEPLLGEPGAPTFLREPCVSLVPVSIEAARPGASVDVSMLDASMSMEAPVEIVCATAAMDSLSARDAHEPTPPLVRWIPPARRRRWPWLAALAITGGFTLHAVAPTFWPEIAARGRDALRPTVASDADLRAVAAAGLVVGERQASPAASEPTPRVAPSPRIAASSSTPPTTDPVVVVRSSAVPPAPMEPATTRTIDKRRAKVKLLQRDALVTRGAPASSTVEVAAPIADASSPAATAANVDPASASPTEPASEPGPEPRPEPGPAPEIDEPPTDTPPQQDPPAPTPPHREPPSEAPPHEAPPAPIDDPAADLPRVIDVPAPPSEGVSP